ncbi:ABC transporter ATP-binding protein [Paenibacillus sabuli]|nr:ABC transporter ATP-binding protein [Paenibacillus sabuli]
MDTEAVISAKNLGVSYISGYRTDDYKSYIYHSLFRKKGNSNKNVIWPIKNIDFTGYKGEILGIIGSNGSGKTTLCKLISGILTPEEGQLQVKGEVTALFSLGLGFNKELTGRENVYMSGMILGIKKKKIQQYINDIHKFSGIGEFMDRSVKHYSSGMKARLGFSIVALMEPEILVLDEALNTGDLAFSTKAAEKMKELVKKAKMVIMVTHSIGYAERNCDRLIWLDKGVIKAVGAPNKVAEMYKASVPQKKAVKKNNKIEFKQTEIMKRDNLIVEAKSVGVRYKVKGKMFQALENVSFKIKEGEVVGVIGHNGAGKSTLCKALTNILVPDQGELIVKGRTTALLGFGAGFSQQLTGADNIYLNGMLLGISKKEIDEKYSEIVSFSELEKVIDKPVKQYSSGMKARLGFSIAAVLEPDIFVIDEALSTGDMAFNQKASIRIQEMIDRSKAVIIVTHSMGFVEKICSKAICLGAGKVLFDGSPRDAINFYKDKFSKDIKS